MSSEFELVLVILLAEAVPSAVFLYASYWAFVIRRPLVSRMYRRQATWIGVLAAALAIFVFVTYSTNPLVTDLINVLAALLFALVFAYIDSSIPVIRRSDPLLRDILHWGTLRYFLWFDVGLLGFFNVAPGIIPSLSVGVTGYVFGVIGWLTSAFILFGLSGIAIFVGARRSGDIVLRSSLKWIGALLLVTILSFVVDTSEAALVTNLSYSTYDYFYSYAALPGGAVYVVMGYCLYRAIRALAPIGKILDDT
jgi:hypothetical protein